MATKKDIFKEKIEEYLAASKVRKGEILDSVCEVSGLTRKGAVKRFRRMQLRDPATPPRAGRRTYYTKDVDAALYDVWDAANQPCGELLHPVVGEYVDILTRDGMWRHGDEATGKLCDMGEHTIRRRVAVFLRDRPTAKGLSTTKPSHLKAIIPIFKGPWQECVPGEGQIDTVAHCGDTLLGDFIRSVCYTDAVLYWVILRAQWNNGQEATRANIEQIREDLPVRLLHLHPDTGGEFINWHLKDWCDDAWIYLTRSEPSKKNDNMYVEERNGHMVRKYLGYTRFDCPLLVDLINEYYAVLAQYLNHFQAVRRTTEKKRVGAKYVRRYETQPKTPYQRMLDHPDVPDVVKERVRREHATLNPLLLKQQLDAMITSIMKKQRDHGLGNCGCGRC